MQSEAMQTFLRELADALPVNSHIEIQVRLNLMGPQVACSPAPQQQTTTSEETE